MNEKAWGRDELMVLAAVNYCLGRQTYIVRDCADWLITNWADFSETTRLLVKRDVEERFMMEEKRIGMWPLGSACDKMQWERVRKLWQ